MIRIRSSSNIVNRLTAERLLTEWFGIKISNKQNGYLRAFYRKLGKIFPGSIRQDELT